MAIAGAYFAALCLYCVLWLRTLAWPSAASSEGAEVLAIFVVAASPLILLAAILGLVEPRKPVARITGLIVLSMFVELLRADGTMRAARPLEGAIAAVILLLGVVGIIVVGNAKRKPSAARSDAGAGGGG